MTTRKFLEAFGFASLRDLPDLERLKAEGHCREGQGEDDLDSALGLAEEEQDSLEDNDATLDVSRLHGNGDEGWGQGLNTPCCHTSQEVFIVVFYYCFCFPCCLGKGNSRIGNVL